MPQESSRENPAPLSGYRADLTKLVFSLIAVFFGYWLFLRFEDFFLYRHWTQSTGSLLNRYLRLGDIIYPLRALFLLLEMLVVVWLFRPASRLWRDASKLARANPLPYDVGVGIGGGLAGFLVTIPFLGGVRATPFISGLITPGHPFRLDGILAILLIGLFLPVATEFVFRAIVQGNLTEHMSHFAAIVVSATLGACLWSIFNFPFSISLGLLCGALFWWRRALLPAVVADVVMTLSAGIYVGSRIWS